MFVYIIISEFFVSYSSLSSQILAYMIVRRFDIFNFPLFMAFRI